MLPQDTPRLQDMKRCVETLQESICAALEERDGGRFGSELWQRAGGGGGRTRVLQGGALIDKGGVNVSTVWGEMDTAAAAGAGMAPGPFAACGLSLVIHPVSPRVPSVHMNVRCFVAESGRDWWYGGGADLSPTFPYPEDFVHFHAVLKGACEGAAPGSYAVHKKRCDEYFTLPHRNEMRGIGGVFFDHQREDPGSFCLVQALAEAFLATYLPIVDRRRGEIWTPEDKEFQLVRRGRYVEFNLLYDRGTRFGLATGGRAESILMSLPREAAFPYDWKPRRGSRAEEMIPLYQPRPWA
jgi:coproporphyrinogen III oxidase